MFFYYFCFFDSEETDVNFQVYTMIIKIHTNKKNSGKSSNHSGDNSILNKTTGAS